MSDDAMVELRAMLDRMQNPPWWNLLGRWSNWSLRLDKAYVSGDEPAQRWVRYGLFVRLLWALGMILWVAFSDINVWGAMLVAGTLAAWIIGRHNATRCYEAGYMAGQVDGVDAVRKAARGE